MPKFSIIVPVYNVERYLNRCVDSILNQTYSDFELILVDDGSTDNCSDICDNYASIDKRVNVIHKNNGGVSSARNTGIKIAVGDYITFCDSDDYYKLNMLETVSDKLSVTDADILCFNYDTLTSNGQKQGSNIDVGMFDITDTIDKFCCILVNTFRSFLCWSMCTCFYNAKMIHKYDLKVCETCNNYAEDIGFNIKTIMHADSIIGIPDSLYVYDRTREESMMNSGKGVFKFNDVNEVCFDVWTEYNKSFDNLYSDYIAIVLFQLMYSEYVEMIWQNKIKCLPQELNKIQRKEWYIRHTENTLKARKTFLNYYDKKQVGEYMAICRYCLGGSYRKYHFECWINHFNK